MGKNKHNFIKKLQLVEEKLGYKFKDHDLAMQAFTHSSAKQDSLPDYERLEFLGDAILGMQISVMLYQKYPNMTEGMMTKLKSKLVCGKTLYKVADSLQLSELIITSKSLGNKNNRQQLLANVCESLLAAIYLDSSFSTVCRIIKKIFGKLMIAYNDPELVIDAKSRLQEFAQKSYGELPIYTVESMHGPEHARKYNVKCLLNEIASDGSGTSKKSAEVDAAMNWLNKYSEQV